MTYAHKIKCLNCGLHFVVFSWKWNWRPVSCPECLQDLSKGGFLLWVATTDRQIYEFVPGATHPTEFHNL
jgi:hypothetical protein